MLCICLNEPFSGSIQCARNAREVLLEEFPQAQVRVLDSRLATVLQGLLVIEAVRLRDAGCSLEEAAGIFGGGLRQRGRIFFTTNDLEYLRHGGRIGKAAAATGSLLRVKPLIGYEGDGLVTDGIAPGRKNSLNRVMELFYRYLTRREIDLNDYYLATGLRPGPGGVSGLYPPPAGRFGGAGLSGPAGGGIHIGVTIGVHTGPTPIGVGHPEKGGGLPWRSAGHGKLKKTRRRKLFFPAARLIDVGWLFRSGTARSGTGRPPPAELEKGGFLLQNCCLPFSETW